MDTDSEKKKIVGIWATVGVILLIVLVGAPLVANNYRKYLSSEELNRPHHIQALDRGLELTDHNGRQMNLADLRGKVFVVGYVFTRCPSQCIGLAHEMSDLQKEYAGENFHLVAVTLNPEYDTPEVLKSWVEVHGLDDSNWTFATGDPEKIRNYMNKYFHFTVRRNTGDAESINENGLFAHSPELALVDQRGMVRKIYNVVHEQFGDDAKKRLIKDIRYVLDENVKPFADPRIVLAVIFGILALSLISVARSFLKHGKALEAANKGRQD